MYGFHVSGELGRIVMEESVNSVPLKKILFVSHKRAQCGVYEYGKNVTDVLQHSQHYQFIRVECSSLGELRAAVDEYAPAAIIYNYHPSVLPWVATKIGPRLYRSNIVSITVPHIGIIHEINQSVSDTATSYRKKYLISSPSRLINSLFDYYIAPDPTLLLLNPLVYKTGRLIPPYQNTFPHPAKPVIGSFGFGTPNKGFDHIIRLVQEEFDEASIRLNIPAAEYGDKTGENAQGIAEQCKALIMKPGIRLQVTHDFMDRKTILDFLAQNTINLFLYTDKNNRGLSSTVDYAVAARRPIAVSDGVMFRHVLDVEPSICIEKNSLRTIIQNGFAPLQKHYDEWNSETLLWEYERILNSVFARRQNVIKRNMGTIRRLRSQCYRLLSMPDKTFTWLRNSAKAIDDDMTVNTSVKYQPIHIPSGVPLNRILDDDARKLYEVPINKLIELAPITMSQKITEANVQQAFVFDTVFRHLSQYQHPKLLCVGCYKDTASMGLRKMGVTVEEIDPMLNYYLQEYVTKPSTVKESYDIIFSTSVIEHDPDDESFVKDIAYLLAPGGVAVMTCDYKEGWKPGDPKPDAVERFYTKQDLKDRLLPLMDNCRLIDEPQWECPNPDFNYLGKYQYTFATFVLRRNR
jgi:SAM-dependent methyltransferase